MNYKVCIIGGGPSGVMSSFYLNRFSISNCIFEYKEIGGCLRYANLVENFPFLKPTCGLKLTEILKRYLKKGHLIREKVKKIDFLNDSFFIYGNKTKITSKYLILSTGTAPVIDSIFDKVKDVINRFEEKILKISNKRILIIGGGDIAFDYALNMAKRKNKIKIFVRGYPKTYKFLFDKAKKNKYISIYLNTVVKDIEFIKNNFRVSFKIEDKLQTDFFDLVVPAGGRTPYYGDIDGVDKFINNNDFKNRFFLCGDVNRNRNRFLVNCFSDALNIAFNIKELEYEGDSKSWEG